MFLINKKPDKTVVNHSSLLGYLLLLSIVAYMCYLGYHQYLRFNNSWLHFLLPFGSLAFGLLFACIVIRMISLRAFAKKIVFDFCKRIVEVTYYKCRAAKIKKNQKMELPLGKDLKVFLYPHAGPRNTYSLSVALNDYMILEEASYQEVKKVLKYFLELEQTGALVFNSKNKAWATQNPKLVYSHEFLGLAFVCFLGLMRALSLDNDWYTVLCLAPFGVWLIYVVGNLIFNPRPTLGKLFFKR